MAREYLHNRYKDIIERLKVIRAITPDDPKYIVDTSVHMRLDGKHYPWCRCSECFTHYTDKPGYIHWRTKLKQAKDLS